MNRVNSRRFLNAFIEIEQALRTLSGNHRHRPFYSMVNDAARKDPFVREISVELKEYADLRNAIVHERIDDQPIAEPHVKTVERLEKISSLLRTPPKVESEFLGPVISCSPNDLISAVAKQMGENSLSKIPVYHGEKFLGLLTAEAITHWLGDHLVEGHNLVRETVATILSYMANTDNYRFVSKQCTIFEIVALFEKFSHEGRRLQAILITDDGAADRKPLGIITVFDLPKIYRAIDVD